MILSMMLICGQYREMMMQKIIDNIISRKEEHFGAPWSHIVYPDYKKWINEYRSGKRWANENGHKLEKTTTKW